MPQILEITNAAFGYGRHRGTQTVLQDVNLVVGKGELVAVIGRNGSGKSTLLRGALGILPLLAGKVQWHMPCGDIGYVPQESLLDFDLPASALDVVRTAMPFAWGSCRNTALEMLGLVGMKELANVRYDALSGGQKRRVQIARALTPDPRILVLDEPTVNVDQETETLLGQLLVRLSKERNVSTLLATHTRADGLPARKYHIDGGRVCE